MKEVGSASMSFPSEKNSLGFFNPITECSKSLIFLQKLIHQEKFRH